jgi:hypothetical protein
MQSIWNELDNLMIKYRELNLEDALDYQRFICIPMSTIQLL